MSHGGGGGGIAQQPSCTAVPMGKSVRRALRAAIGMPKPKKRKDKPKMKIKKPTAKDDPAPGSGSSSTELLSSFSKEAARRRESVVRVVLSSGVVEVYRGVVLACTVIRKHPPGLCLAHPDVFRNPHGAVVRPLEPLFPGQKFLLIPWSTVHKLKQRIPESSIGAFADEDQYGAVDDEEEGEGTGSEEATSSTETEASEEERDEEATVAGDGGGVMPACSAREYFVARDQWSLCHFKRLVEQGLAVEPSTDDQPDQSKGKGRQKGKKKRKAKGNKKRRERRPATPPAGIRAFATPRRAWEPSLPSVVEEDNAVSPSQSPASIGGGLQKR